MVKRLIPLASICFMALSSIALAQQDPLDILRTLSFKGGSITLGDNLVELALTQNFRYLNNADTQTFLTRIWGNPPGAAKNALGMIIPTDANPLDKDGWAALIEYDASGYVSDDEAGKINYDDLMQQMQEATREASKRRVAQGLERIELLGWARKPYYDATTKKLFWAKRLRFGDSEEETLNYNIRILGRRGVVDLNVIASMNALPSIDQKVQAILSMTHFIRGNTYAEYDSNTDSAAAYGLAGLIAGGVLAKAGFFKGLLALLLAGKKAVIIGGFALLIGVWNAIKRVFSGKPKPVAYVPAYDDPPAYDNPDTAQTPR